MSVENKLKNLYNSGSEFTKNKQFQKALDCYNKILKTTPNDVKTLYKKCIALENLCKYDKAVQCYDVILKIRQGEFIFSETDYKNPEKSETFKKINELPSSQIQYFLKTLKTICKNNNPSIDHPPPKSWMTPPHP